MTLLRNGLDLLSWKRAAGLIGAVVVMATLAACARPVAASGDVHMGPADRNAMKVIADDNEFKPARLSSPAGSEVTLEIANEGERQHNLVIDDLDLSTGTLEPGGVATATITGPDTAVPYYCSFHPGMEGELQPTK